MGTKVNYRINHQKLSGEWMQHVRRDWHKIISKKRRAFLKEEQNK